MQREQGEGSRGAPRPERSPPRPVPTCTQEARSSARPSAAARGARLGRPAPRMPPAPAAAAAPRRRRRRLRGARRAHRPRTGGRSRHGRWGSRPQRAGGRRAWAAGGAARSAPPPLPSRGLRSPSVRLGSADTQQVGAGVTASLPIRRRGRRLHINEGDGPAPRPAGGASAAPAAALKGRRAALAPPCPDRSGVRQQGDERCGRHPRARSSAGGGRAPACCCVWGGQLAHGAGGIATGCYGGGGYRVGAPLLVRGQAVCAPTLL